MAKRAVVFLLIIILGGTQFFNLDIIPLSLMGKHKWDMINISKFLGLSRLVEKISTERKAQAAK